VTRRNKKRHAGHNGADEEFLHDHVRGDDRVALDRSGATIPGEAHCRLCQLAAHAALAKSPTDQETRDGPDAVVGPGLIAALPRDAIVADQALVVAARLDRAPAHRLPVEVGDETAGGLRLRLAGIGLLTEPIGAFFGGKPDEILLPAQLEPLALASRRRAGRAEDRLQVIPARLVGGYDGDRGFSCRHAKILRPCWSHRTTQPLHRPQRDPGHTLRAASPPGMRTSDGSGNNGEMALDATAAFESAAGFFVDLVDTIPPTAWDRPGLGEWDLRSLVGHTGRSLITVTTYLTRPTEVVDVPSAVEYYRWTVQQIGADPAGVAERGRQAGIALGEDPAAAVRLLRDDAVTAVRQVDGDPIIETIAGGMHVSAYLPTRIFELTVHTLDIAAALGRVVAAPPEPLGDALDLAAKLALLKGDGEELLLGLTGRRPLPTNYSVL